MTTYPESQLLADCAFALLEQVLMDPALWSDLPHIPLLPCFYADVNDQLPILIRLKDLSDGQRLKLTQRIEDWNLDHDAPFFCAYLSSKESAERLHQTLSRMLLQEMPDRSKCLFHYNNPLVFQHLRWILTPTQLAALLGPCEAWYWRDANREWLCQERPPLRTFFLSLRAPQLETLGRTGLLNRTLKSLRRKIPTLGSDTSTFQQIDALLKGAVDVEGLNDEADCFLYVQQALTIHPQIHGHPVLRAGLQKARMGDGTYLDACLALDDDVLRAWAYKEFPGFKELP
ncbi:MAG: DUF4123 domain-containing protein [Pseudomonas sp.]